MSDRGRGASAPSRRVHLGAKASLLGMGVRDPGAVDAKLLPDLPQVESGWNVRDQALFKWENNQLNIGLGRSGALVQFNDSIVEFERVSQ